MIASICVRVCGGGVSKSMCVRVFTLLIPLGREISSERGKDLSFVSSYNMFCGFTLH